MDRLLKYSNYSFRVLVIGYTVLAIYYFLNKPAGSGDESLFLNDLLFITQNGWIAAIQKGISIPYMLLVYPVSKIIAPIWALRGVNILLFIGLLGYFKYYCKINSLNIYFLALFFFSSLGYFMVGTNDTLFIIAMAIFFIESHFLFQNDFNKNNTLWVMSLVVAFFTREMFLLFVPLIFIMVYFVVRYRKFPKIKWVYPMLLSLVLLTLNYPSLTAHGKLSFDSKNPPQGVSATWPQRQYLAQLWVNEGKLKNFQHPSWEQTESYLKTNGENSLPKTIFSSILFNVNITLQEFVKDFAYILQYSIRSMGLMVLLSLFIGFGFFRKNRSFNHNTILPLLLLLTMATFSLVIISFIELRWLASIFLASIVYFHLKSESREIPKFWIIANYCLLCILCLYGSYGLFLKI